MAHRPLYLAPGYALFFLSSLHRNAWLLLWLSFGSFAGSFAPFLYTVPILVSNKLTPCSDVALFPSWLKRQDRNKTSLFPVGWHHWMTKKKNLCVMGWCWSNVLCCIRTMHVIPDSTYTVFFFFIKDSFHFKGCSFTMADWRVKEREEGRSMDRSSGLSVRNWWKRCIDVDYSIRYQRMACA